MSVFSPLPSHRTGHFNAFLPLISSQPCIRHLNMASASAGDCTPDTCPVAHGFLSEPPSLEGAVIILAAFAALIPINLWIGARGKTMTYTLIMVTGLLVEIMGYVGRLLLRSDPASKTYFLLFLLGTIMGPTFITAAIYTILPHVLALYGSDSSIVPEIVWANYFFLFCDIFTLVFQALGSVFAVEGFNKTQVRYVYTKIYSGAILMDIPEQTRCECHYSWPGFPDCEHLKILRHTLLVHVSNRASKGISRPTLCRRLPLSQI